MGGPKPPVLPITPPGNNHFQFTIVDFRLNLDAEQNKIRAKTNHGRKNFFGFPLVAESRWFGIDRALSEA